MDAIYTEMLIRNQDGIHYVLIALSLRFDNIRIIAV